MSTLAERLKERRREAQDSNHYSSSSRWYEALSKAISAIEQAEVAADSVDRFTKAYWAADGLSRLYGERGDEDIVAFQRWIEEIQTAPDVTSKFMLGRAIIPLADFRDAVARARNTVLRRDGLQQLEAWRDNTPPAKACGYFFTICRAIRNRLFHADLNLNSSSIKKVLGLGADCLIPVVAAAALRCIEWPPKGTTGRAPAYRFFLYPFLKNSDTFFSDYYLERLFPDDELVAFPEDQAKASLKQIAKQLENREPALRTADAGNTFTSWLEPVLFDVLGAKPVADVRIIGEEAVFEPTFVLPKAGASAQQCHGDLRGKAAGNSLACLVWALPWHTSLDSVATDSAFAALPVTEVVHRALAASDVPWAIVTNGRQLRLLSRSTSHRPRCFLEADLVALVDRRTKPQALRAFRFVLGLFSARCFTDVDEAGRSLLDRVAQGSERHGKEIGDELKANVFSALEELGEGFLAYMRANLHPTDEWRARKRLNFSRERFLASDELLDDIYHESLSLMYRLLFLFYAESRELLPLDNELYQSYSLESIRDDVHSVLDDPDKSKRFFAKGNTDLWERLKELFSFLDKGWGKVIPPYNGGLFDPKKHQFLDAFAVGDYYLARAIDLLSRTKPRAGQNRGEGRKKVTYRDLDVRHLGSIYEGILEYTAHIADQEYAVLRQGSGTAVSEEYRPLTELDRAEKAQLAAWQAAVSEDPENPRVPRGCRVSGHVAAGQYYLVFGGRESKRKSSGSYYTPDYIVQYIVENTLGPLVRGECRPAISPLATELNGIGWKQQGQRTGPLTSDELLHLTILDPAMGSGHFLVAATEYLARAYRDARLAEGSIPDEAKADEEFIRYKRTIAERCIYGVDFNPMAVELAKLSMWLFTMDPGRPLSFLDHHLKYGNSLIGAWSAELGIDPTVGGSTRRLAEVKSRQQNLFEAEFKKTLPTMLQDIFKISARETLTTQDITDKKALDELVEGLKHPFRVIADTWTAAHFGGEVSGYFDLLVHPEKASKLPRPKDATNSSYFHWEIEFPEVWFDASANRKREGGFAAIIGNPPYLRELDNKHLFAAVQAAPLGAMYSSSKMNLWYYFAHRSLQLLQSCGLHSFICPAYWPLSDSAKKLIRHIGESRYVALFIDFGKNTIFENVADRSSIYVLRLMCEHPQSLCVLFAEELPEADILKGLEALPEQIDHITTVVRRPWSDVRLGDRLNLGVDATQGPHAGRPSIQLAEIGVLVSQGIAQNPDRLSGRNVASAAEEYKMTVDQLLRRHRVEIGDGVFVISEATLKELKLSKAEQDLLGPFYDAEELCLLTRIPTHDKWIIYSSSETSGDIQASEKLMGHLKKYRFMMELRRETKAGTRPWWEMHWPRQRSYFTAPRLIVPQMSSRPTFVYAEAPAYVNMSVNLVVCPNKLTARVLWALLNGPSTVDGIISVTKKRGANIDLGVAGIRAIPIPRGLPWARVLAGDTTAVLPVRPALDAFDAVKNQESQLVTSLNGMLGQSRAWELLRGIGPLVDRESIENVVSQFTDGSKRRSVVDIVFDAKNAIRSALANAEAMLWGANAAD